MAAVYGALCTSVGVYVRVCAHVGVACGMTMTGSLPEGGTAGQVIK